MHMRGKTVCKCSVKMKIQVVSIFSKTNRLLYSTTILESTFRGITVGLALVHSRRVEWAVSPVCQTVLSSISTFQHLRSERHAYTATGKCQL